MNMNKAYIQTILRVLLGLLFVVPGIGKIMNPAGIIGMLGELGFPGPAFFGWVLILSEIVFGAALVIGYKVRWTVWPPIIILAVATITVHIPTLGTPMGPINVLFHLVGIASLLVIAASGPGVCAVCKD